MVSSVNFVCSDISLTSIYKAEPRSAKFELGPPNIANRLLTGLVSLISTAATEERTKLCFIIGKCRLYHLPPNTTASLSTHNQCTCPHLSIFPHIVHLGVVLCYQSGAIRETAIFLVRGRWWSLRVVTHDQGLRRRDTRWKRWRAWYWYCANSTAALVTDDTTLQKIAASLDCPSLVMEILHSIEQDSTDGRLGVDTVARGREVSSLCLQMLMIGCTFGIDCIGFQSGINPGRHCRFDDSSLDLPAGSAPRSIIRRQSRGMSARQSA